ncbi:MAG: MCP four helix bundle domain-containing protein [Sphingomonas sp.]|nr:MCP four helix bundle domain-containing protein [Sphingomonas sp.]
MRLPRKLMLAFGFVAVLLACLAFNGLASTSKISIIARAQVTHGVSGLSALADVISQVKEQRIIVYSHYNAISADDSAKLEKRLADAQKALSDSVKDYGKVGQQDFPAETTKLEQFAAALNDVNGRIVELRKTGDLDGTLKLIKGEGKDKSHDLIEQVQTLTDLTRKLSSTTSDAADSAASWAFTIGILLVVVAFASLAGVWMLIDRRLAKPMDKLTSVTTRLANGELAEVPAQQRGDELGEIARAVEQFRSAAVKRAEADRAAAAEQREVTEALDRSLKALSAGDLTADLAGGFPASYAELRTNFNGALASLRALVGAVRSSAMAIRSGSDEIAHASEDLAKRSEANAASLSQTTSAVSEMDKRLQTMVGAATRTVTSADGAISTVSSGRSIADEAMNAMNRVSESAKGIDSVIEGLDKIAFQTRVLAMNAAVEAGRAGEAGRGFAVVADLVSALAMRAEEEAGRARDQLTATQADIVAAVEMVQKVDGALANISDDVSNVHGLLGQMASDNEAQSAAVSQINSTIGGMDRATQQNAAMVEETSAAARNLASEVTVLAEHAAQFRVGDDDEQRAAPVRRPAPAPARAPVAAAKPVTPKLNGNGQLVGSDGDWATF